MLKAIKPKAESGKRKAESKKGWDKFAVAGFGAMVGRVVG